MLFELSRHAGLLELDHHAGPFRTRLAAGLILGKW